jgi:hypothetical protein
MPVGGNSFSAVRKARAALKERAQEFIDLQMRIIKESLSAGDYETAAKANQFMLEHIPADEGERVLDISVDKPKQVESGPKGPSIQIGVAIGGITPTKALPEVIDVTAEAIPEPDPSSSS